MRFGDIEDEYVFVCECSAIECAERLTLTVRQYEEIRAVPTHFVVVPGHTDPGVEIVIERAESHHVVEKVGTAAVIAEQLDERNPERPPDRN